MPTMRDRMPFGSAYGFDGALVPAPDAKAMTRQLLSATAMCIQLLVTSTPSAAQSADQSGRMRNPREAQSHSEPRRTEVWPHQLPLATPQTEPRVSAMRAAPHNMLPSLVGAWRFRLGDRRGTREVRPLYGDYSVEYVETFDGTDIQGRGILTFDPSKGRYLSMGLHNRVGTGGSSVGTPVGEATTIVFRPTLTDQEDYPTESWLIVQGPDRFLYELKQRVDGTWRTRWTAEFSRVHH